MEAREASLRKPPLARCQPPEATLREGIESTRDFLLTDLPPLTHTLIIEELRPEETPRGRFFFLHIADPDPAAS